MAQSFEYYMWSPHPKAKVYKRFTGDIPVELKDNEVITVEGNRYVYAGKITWVETSAKSDTDEQPLDGLIVQNSYLTVKTNSLKKFSAGDIIDLPRDTQFGGMWIITDGISTDMIYTPKPIQTYQYLPLSSVG